MKRLIVILMLIGIVAISGCLDTDSTDDPTTGAVSIDPQERCTEVCKEQIAAGVDLSVGPCLSEKSDVGWEIEDWACDVAHEPRKTIDDVSQNQCQEYRKNIVNHFVEVTPNCEFIRKT